jgi:hypothetical protein
MIKIFKFFRENERKIMNLRYFGLVAVLCGGSLMGSSLSSSSSSTSSAASWEQEQKIKNGQSNLILSLSFLSEYVQFGGADISTPEGRIAGINSIKDIIEKNKLDVNFENEGGMAPLPIVFLQLERLNPDLAYGIIEVLMKAGTQLARAVFKQVKWDSSQAVNDGGDTMLHRGVRVLTDLTRYKNYFAPSKIYSLGPTEVSQIMELLLAHTKDVDPVINLRNSAGETPLIVAIQGYKKSVEWVHPVYLSALGTPFGPKNRGAAVVAVLLKYGATIMMEDYSGLNGKSALDHAKGLPAIETLLEVELTKRRTALTAALAHMPRVLNDLIGSFGLY